MDKKEELKIDLLIKEYESIGQGIRTLFITNEKIIGLGFTIIATGLTFGIKEEINEILLFLPVAIFGMMLYGVHIFTELMSMSGYRRCLEEKINVLLEDNILHWESSVVQKKHRTFGNYLLYIVYFLFLVLAIFVSLSTAWQHYSDKVFWGIASLTLGLLVALIISIVEMNKVRDKTYQNAKKAFLGEGIIGTPPNTAQMDKS